MSVMPRSQPAAPDGTNLADILERVLDRGVVIAGDIKISLLDIELLTIKLRLVVASVDTAREMGIDWWERDPFLSSRPRAVAADTDATAGDPSRPVAADEGGPAGDASRPAVPTTRRTDHEGRTDREGRTGDEVRARSGVPRRRGDRERLDARRGQR